MSNTCSAALIEAAKFFDKIALALDPALRLVVHVAIQTCAECIRDGDLLGARKSLGALLSVHRLHRFGSIVELMTWERWSCEVVGVVDVLQAEMERLVRETLDEQMLAGNDALLMREPPGQFDIN